MQEKLLLVRFSSNVRLHCFPTFIFNFDMKMLPTYQQQRRFQLLLPASMHKFFMKWLADLQQIAYPGQFYLNRVQGYLLTERWSNPDCLPTRCRLVRQGKYENLLVEFIFGRNGSMLLLPANLELLLKAWSPTHPARRSGTAQKIAA